MTMWNRLLVTLDQALGFPNKVSSNVVKKWQGFDNTTQEHVITLEYRVKINPVVAQKPDPRLKAVKQREANLLRELLRYLDKHKQ